MNVMGGDYWDQVPDDELEETLVERLTGLGEMFPEGVRGAASKTLEWTLWGVQGTFGLARSAIWIVATSSMVMFLPYIIERERSDMEKNQIAQQRQMLLGPSAAVAAAGKAGQI